MEEGEEREEREREVTRRHGRMEGFDLELPVASGATLPMATPLAPFGNVDLGDAVGNSLFSVPVAAQAAAPASLPTAMAVTPNPNVDVSLGQLLGGASQLGSTMNIYSQIDALSELKRLTSQL